MKITGFSFIRNAIKFDYPILESINSVLPLVDEFIIACGKSEDDTLALIQSINSPKIKIIETEWNLSLREGGKVLAEETNKAFAEISADSDWAFYIQGDEVIHEKDYDNILFAAEKWKNDQQVEGLLFDYKHFYGSYDYIGDSRTWYRNEIRIIRADKNIASYRDAQGFRKNGRPLNVKKIEASIYHYGWVKPPEFQQAKQETFNKLWHDDNWMEKKIAKTTQFDYSKIDSLQKFNGIHPSVMTNRIAEKNWTFEMDISRKNFTPKQWFLYQLEKITGYRIGEYKNYKLL